MLSKDEKDDIETDEAFDCLETLVERMEDKFTFRELASLICKEYGTTLAIIDQHCRFVEKVTPVAKRDNQEIIIGGMVNAIREAREHRTVH